MSRLESLLGDLGLQDRICCDENSFVEFSEKLVSIDYRRINQKLEQLRINSHLFLEENLK